MWNVLFCYREILQVAITDLQQRDATKTEEIEELNEEMVVIKNENRSMRREIDAMKQVMELIWLDHLTIFQNAAIITELQAQSEQHTQQMDKWNERWQVAQKKQV